jgi:hypothetical protein
LSVWRVSTGYRLTFFRHFRFVAAFQVLAFVSVLALGGCSGNSETKKSTACTPGRSIACNGSEGCAGHQVCSKDGAAYGSCVCAGDETFPSAGPSSGLLGAQCVDDADCRKGFSCLDVGSHDIAGEGPSSGLCVLPCQGDDSVCAVADPATTCVVLDDRGSSDTTDDAAYCLPTCTLGAPAPNDDKCRGRIDLVCSEATAGTGVGYCRPACRSDLDCAERVCDLRTGLCADDKPTGDAIGSACDPAQPSCAGGCVDHGSNYAECSGVCRLNTPGCGQRSSSGPPYDYWCYLDPSNAGGDGDLGYCTRACDCDDDCGRADAVCEPRSSLAGDTGRKGLCASKVFASGGARPNLPCR